MNIEPPPINGINIWCLSTARKCEVAGIPAWEAHQRIMSYQGQTRRPLKESEVRRAVERAYSTTLAPTYVKKFQDKWEPVKTRRTSRRPVVEVADLWEASPVRMDEGVTQEMILDWLFPDPDGLLCVGKTAFIFKTGKRADLPNLKVAQFIVSSYMTSVHGETQEGKRSMHTLSNTGPRRYCVCDFDEPASELHPSIIWHLRKIAPLVMVLSSGGKSLHAWFRVPEHSEPDFWKAAIECGADPALMRNRSSFVRMPMGTRDNGKSQSVIYFDPSKTAE